MHHYAILTVELIALAMLVIGLRARARMSWPDGVVVAVLLVVVGYISTLVFPKLEQEIDNIGEQVAQKVQSIAPKSKTQATTQKTDMPTKTTKTTRPKTTKPRPTEGTQRVVLKPIPMRVIAQSAKNFWRDDSTSVGTGGSLAKSFPAPAGNDDFWNSPTSGTSAPWKTTLAQAVTLERGGKYQEALTLLNQALKEGGDQDPQLYFYLGVVHNKSNDLDAAQKNYTKAVELDKNFTSAWYNLATTYYLQRQYQKAVDSYTKVIALNPKSSVAWRFRGYAYEQLDQPEKAKADLDEADRLKDSNSGS